MDAPPPSEDDDELGSMFLIAIVIGSTGFLLMILGAVYYLSRLGDVPSRKAVGDAGGEEPPAGGGAGDDEERQQPPKTEENNTNDTTKTMTPSVESTVPPPSPSATPIKSNTTNNTRRQSSRSTNSVNEVSAGGATAAPAAAVGATAAAATTTTTTPVAPPPAPAPAAKPREELIEIYAPAGKLGVVLDTPGEGPPRVHEIRPTSVLKDELKVGDKLIALDDEDVRQLTANKVSKLISRKMENSTRKLSIIRTIDAVPDV